MPKDENISNDDREKILKCIENISYIVEPKTKICLSSDAQLLI